MLQRKRRAAVNEDESPHAKAATGSFAEWLRGWRYFFWFLAALLLVMLFYAEENWRGPWAWARYRMELKTRGQRIKASDFIPPHVPDDQNFALTPVLASTFGFRTTLARQLGSKGLNAADDLVSKFERVSKEARPKFASRANTWTGPPFSLAMWQEVLLQVTNQTVLPRERLMATNFTAAEAAAAVLDALVGYEPVVAELQAASQRPLSRFNLAYETPNPAAILLPHLSVLRQLSTLVSLRACAELTTGQAEAAFADVKLLLRLAEATRDEPILVSQLVRARQLESAMQPIADGLSQWTEAQLRALQTRLESFDFCADGSRTLRSECFLFGEGIIEYVRRSEDKPNLLSGLMSGGSNQGPDGLEWAGVLMSVAPEGWFDLERLNYCRQFEAWLLPAIDATNRLVLPSATRRAEAKSAAWLKHSAPGLYFRHQLFCGLLLPHIEKAAERMAFAQAAADTAIVACALERFRRSHTQFPDSLASLMPEFLSRLPDDVINGHPFKYRRTEDGLYVLYSVGWNESDDGGRVEFTKGGELDRRQGDWVWRPRLLP